MLRPIISLESGKNALCEDKVCLFPAEYFFPASELTVLWRGLLLGLNFCMPLYKAGSSLVLLLCSFFFKCQGPDFQLKKN